ncbi:hypothetical protein WR25_01747 [Diploscapter pachys]|uniref:tRNA (adenine(58)-N(1))-methyltransferase non-catalytic subunit TRM6 n=1 Tax=Diploscapter pachys TaxID=2018661 RepID=A0A2A2LZ97_9BILA|nr:hypothetical protein WR25_01747 [Diploscapter pachys]
MDDELGENEERLILAGRFVATQKIGAEQIRILKFNQKSKVGIDRLKFDTDSAIGRPYGLFEVANGRVQPIATSKQLGDKQLPKRDLLELPKLVSGDSESVDEVAAAASDCAPSSSSNQKNEAGAGNAVDVQAISHDEVVRLKEAGISGDTLVAKLVQGSSTFSQRSLYGQEKYIQRKSNKHSCQVLLLKPTISLIAQSYYLKDPERIGNLRGDLLGLLLQYGGIHSSRKVLVFDQVLGLLTSAVLSRLSGQGACIHIHRGNTAQSIPCVSAMNYNEQIMSTFMPVRIQSALQGKALPWSESNQQNQRKKTPAPTKNESGSFTLDEANGDGEPSAKKPRLGGDSTDLAIEEEENETEMDDVEKRRVLRTAREEMGIAVMKEGVDSLVFATRTVHPQSLLEKLYPHLKMSGTISIFSPQLNPLLEAYDWLRQNHTVVQMQLSDQMCRNMQVLPDRTHPLMSQSIGGGFILSGIKVDNTKPTVTIPGTNASGARANTAL